MSASGGEPPGLAAPGLADRAVPAVARPAAERQDPAAPEPENRGVLGRPGLRSVDSVERGRSPRRPRIPALNPSLSEASTKSNSPYVSLWGSSLLLLLVSSFPQAPDGSG